MQTERAIDVFDSRSKGRATALFMFDNASTHQKRPKDGLSARYMPKKPTDGWMNPKSNARMRDGSLPDSSRQSFYFEDDHVQYPGFFKGMEIIIRERGLWPEGGLRSSCPGFKCPEGQMNCCCRRLLFTQPDFMAQKSALEELITSRGHLCDFYPKFHCELNFIEMYWGAAKLRYRATPKTSSTAEMRKNMKECLDNVPKEQILR